MDSTTSLHRPQQGLACLCCPSNPARHMPRLVDPSGHCCACCMAACRNRCILASLCCSSACFTSLGNMLWCCRLVSAITCKKAREQGTHVHTCELCSEVNEFHARL